MDLTFSDFGWWDAFWGPVIPSQEVQNYIPSESLDPLMILMDLMEFDLVFVAGFFWISKPPVT